MTMVHAAALPCAMACGQAADEPREFSDAEKERIFMLKLEIHQTEGPGQGTEGMAWLREIVRRGDRPPTVADYHERRRRAARLAKYRSKVAGGMVCGAAFVISTRPSHYP